MISPWQLLIVLLVVLLIFGTKRLRGAGRDLGEAIKGFKKGVGDEDPPSARIEDRSREDEVRDAQQRSEQQRSESDSKSPR